MIKRLLKRYADFLRTVADSLEGIDDDSNEEIKPDSAEYTDEERRLIEYTTPYFEKMPRIQEWRKADLELISKFLQIGARIRFHKDYEDGIFERINYPVKFKTTRGEVTIRDYSKMYSDFSVCVIMY